LRIWFADMEMAVSGTSARVGNQSDAHKGDVGGMAVQDAADGRG
jgi:hypothetical protein